LKSGNIVGSASVQLCLPDGAHIQN